MRFFTRSNQLKPRRRSRHGNRIFFLRQVKNQSNSKALTDASTNRGSEPYTSRGGERADVASVKTPKGYR